MKPKPTIDLDAAGLEVQRLFAEDGTANAALKDMRGAREQRKEQLKKLLPPIWAAFEKGETVNGYSTRKEWCANFAKVSTRHCEHIIYGRKKDEANSVRSGFLSRIAAAKKKLADIQRQIEAPIKEAETLDVNALLRQIDPAIDGVYQEFLALIAPDGYEVMHARNGWLIQEKEEEKPAPVAKKNVEKKPIKHARNPKTYTTSWCSVSLNQNNTAYQTRHSNCPYCIEAMKADVPMKNPENWTRHYQRQLKEMRSQLKRHESMVETCLPENRDRRGYSHSVAAIPELRQEIAEVEQKLAALKQQPTAMSAPKGDDDLTFKEVGERNAAALEKVAKKLASSLSKKESKAYEVLSAKFTNLKTQFLASEIGADGWRAEFKMLDDENSGREVFRTRHNVYMEWIKEAKGRMEAVIAQQPTTVLVLTNNCPTEYPADFLEHLERVNGTPNDRIPPKDLQGYYETWLKHQEEVL